MDTGNRVEPDEEWGKGPDWAGMERLIALARSAHRAELSPERRAEIVERMLERLERNEIRRQRVRIFVAVASALSLVGLLLRLVRARQA
jgi:hypothetical protein